MEVFNCPEGTINTLGSSFTYEVIVSFDDFTVKTFGNEGSTDCSGKGIISTGSVKCFFFGTLFE